VENGSTRKTPPGAGLARAGGGGGSILSLHKGTELGLIMVKPTGVKVDGQMSGKTLGIVGQRLANSGFDCLQSAFSFSGGHVAVSLLLTKSVTLILS